MLILIGIADNVLIYILRLLVMSRIHAIHKKRCLDFITRPIVDL